MSCPLTVDQAAVRLFLEAADARAVPLAGTALADALRAALRALENGSGGSERGRAILLYTDGEDHEGGLDEISISGPTRVTAVEASGKRELEVTPEDAGLGRHAIESLKGGDAAKNADIMEAVLAGEKGAYRDAVVLNAAAALVVQGRAADLRDGAEQAAAAIDTGGAIRVLEALRHLK